VSGTGLEPAGPMVVAIGGGHGLAASLRAIRRYAGAVVAVVSVADDGASSGRLRAELGIPAPGDLRRCLGALLPEGSPMARLLEYRFPGGELGGHAFGNLLIAAMAATTSDFGDALVELGELLDLVGGVLPAAAVPVVLHARRGNEIVTGQARIAATDGIESVFLTPSDATAGRDVLAALAAADQIVIGPGSLFTSVLAALCVGGIREALRAARGRRIYVANLGGQPHETAGYDVGRHLEVLAAHGVEVDVVLADTARIALGSTSQDWPVIATPLAAPNGREHDPGLLAAALARYGSGEGRSSRGAARLRPAGR
jgi:uncharacterized cofD-like protein